MSAKSQDVWTEAKIRALGVRLDGVVAIQILTNYSRSRCYEILRDPKLLPEVRVLKIGRRYIVPTADVLRVLGLEPATGAATGSGPPDTRAD